MDSVDKLWQKVDHLSENQIRQDERIAVVERQNQQMLKHMSTLEGKVQAGIEGLGAKFDECFAELSNRMSEYDAHIKHQEGYEKARRELQATFIKKAGLWISVASIAVGFITWWITK